MFREILPTVAKPSRYTGNELNVIRKDHTSVDVKVALAFPDTYELGMSYLGFAILYHLLNRRDDVCAERVYAPWVDLEKRMREETIPLFTLESKKPLSDFDIVAFTLPYELCYTNILNMLDLASIPLEGTGRGEHDPLILGGGLGAFNPEPLAGFIDAFVIGDGEEAVLEIIDIVKALKGSSRHEKLRSLSELKGIYVPSFYEAHESTGGSASVLPVDPSIPRKIEARTVEFLRKEYYPDAPLMSFTEIEHDRLTIEIMRGCPRACRFCNARLLYRPVRERPVDDIVRQAETGIRATGYDEISLLSLSSTDYSALDELIAKLNRKFAGKRVATALPSLRPDTFSDTLARAVQTVRRSGLTFAPEAGTERLRHVIRKNISDEDLFRAVEIAYENGWNVIKLYFMIGLPTEEQQDIEAIARLVQEVAHVGKKFQNDKYINVAISPFSPKAHTPFQWAAQNDIESLREKTAFLRERLHHGRIKVKWRAPEVSFIESVIARGDRRLSKALKEMKTLGARFDGWSDFFSFPLWQKAFELSEIDPHRYTGRRDITDPLPWEHISIGVSKNTLAKEWQRSQEHTEGTMNTVPPKTKYLVRLEKEKVQAADETDMLIQQSPRTFGRSRKRRTQSPIQIAKARIRIKYAKGLDVRYLSHLDVVRVFERTLRRAEMPIAYSQGFHPHPKIAFGPPLTLGMISKAEYVDMQFEQPYNPESIQVFDRAFPDGFRILKAKPIFGKIPSLSSSISQSEFRIHFDGTFPAEQIEEAFSRLFERTTVWVRRQGDKTIKNIDIRPNILEAKVESDATDVSVLLRLRTSESGHAKPIEVVSETLSLPQQQVSTFLIERTEQLVEREGRLMTPMDCV
ncbi:MAG: TIGR03960 family B12-binding radical SAM protein [Gemmatimonadota bacterium]|nr:MAG: TIGR03960 family B12-binding radical SAM protein [Gemmatimonadota bacterium]